MKKKLKLILLTMISVVLLIGCKQSQNNTTKLVYEKLSTKEEYLLNVTGNKVLMYNIKNFPKDKNYEITLVYEVYKNTEKVKEKMITSILSDNTCDKIDAETIAINIQPDKIRSVFGTDGGYGSGSYDLEEKLDNYSQSYLTNDINLKLGTEIYIYQARANISTLGSVNLGTSISSDELNNVLKNNEENIFIKLVYKEI